MSFDRAILHRSFGREPPPHRIDFSDAAGEREMAEVLTDAARTARRERLRVLAHWARIVFWSLVISWLLTGLALP